jgi:hypothetical protein
MCRNCPYLRDCYDELIANKLLNGLSINEIRDEMSNLNLSRCDWLILCHIAQISQICGMNFNRKQVEEAIELSDISIADPIDRCIEREAVLKAFGVFGRKGKKKRGDKVGVNTVKKAPSSLAVEVSQT